MKISRVFNRIKNYTKHNGEYYLTINQIHQQDVLKDKNIVVTGGSSGIGYSIAKVCSMYGANVIITGIDEKGLKDVASELKCNYIYWDISDVDSIDEKINEIKKIFNNKLDCFVNCAGIYKDIRYNNCVQKDWDSIFNINLKGPYFAIGKIVSEIFDNQKYGNIVIIASNRGVFGDDGPYGISKAGLINYGKGLAKALVNKGVRVNMINPGMTASNINGIKDTDNLFTDSLRGKRVIAAKEIANIVLFLISDSSMCMTGQVINCDNGETVL